MKKILFFTFIMINLFQSCVSEVEKNENKLFNQALNNTIVSKTKTVIIDSISILRNSAERKVLEKDYIGSIQDYKNIINKLQINNKNDSLIQIMHCNIGISFFNMKKYDDAIKEAKIALKLNNKDFTPYAILSNCYNKRAYIQKNNGNFDGYEEDLNLSISNSIKALSLKNN